MPFTVDDFWKLLSAASGETVADLTDALDSIAKSERGRSEDLFSTIIDQPAFDTLDYDRIRKFLIDWYSAFKAIGTASVKATDPHSLTNPDLDELFRSFGYEHSVQLKNFDDNPLPGKVSFFLDLVNLYKRKGTPQSIVDVLQYYGITSLDIYEFFLKFDDINRLYFEGKWVAGTTSDAYDLNFLWPELASGDPHWLLTEDQIRNLHATNTINLPSKTPYFGILPTADVDGPEVAILARLVQDQYQTYAAGGSLEDNAAITIIGETHSLLELYLSAVYMFNSTYSVGALGDRFKCYDGSSIIVTNIVDEYETITAPPTSRANILTRLDQYYDSFTRLTPRNFLQNLDDAETILTAIDPGLKASLDGLGETSADILFSLLKDLANWVRNNLGLGFINLSFIMFGLDAFFEDLKPVVNFFKPYRARLLLLEALQIKNRLFNTIIVEDSIEGPNADFYFHDYLTGDSIPCCNSENIDTTDSTTICLDSTASLHYSRDTYDCGSYHDIGAVTDLKQGIFVEERTVFSDILRCTGDSTAGDNVTNFWVDGDQDDLPIPVDQEGSFNETIRNGGSVTHYTTGGMEDFDGGALFDCTHGFDMVSITLIDAYPDLLLENGLGEILQESGASIRLENFLP
jgi:hypothetical protein